MELMELIAEALLENEMKKMLSIASNLAGMDNDVSREKVLAVLDECGSKGAVERAQVRQHELVKQIGVNHELGIEKVRELMNQRLTFIKQLEEFFRAQWKGRDEIAVMIKERN